jgi:hypothetical protein
MCGDKRSSEDDLTMRYEKYPDEANADAWAIQDACNLQAVARTFMCMARAAHFDYHNPAVLATLDKMNSLCCMQGSLLPERANKLSEAYDICLAAYKKREEEKKNERMKELQRITHAG